MMQTILVADDDKKTVDLVRLYLQRENYGVIEAYDGPQTLLAVRQHTPDLLILDWMLPHLDGPDVCRLLRTETTIPIIMLTAKDTEEDMLLCFRQGADDYVTKPFRPRELMTRVRAVLRRVSPVSMPPQQTVFTVSNIIVDVLAHEVSVGGKSINLTPREFRLLETLMRAPGRTFSRLELLEQVFGPHYEGFERTVDAHILHIRQKIEPDPAEPIFLITVYGIGYKFRRLHDPF